MNGRPVAFAVALLGAVQAAGVAAEPPNREPCSRPRTLYVPVDTADEALGLRGETRAGFLDRVYGKGGWQTEPAGLVQIDPPVSSEGALRITLAERAIADILQLDVIVESRLDYIDKADRRTVIYGHRRLGSYGIERGAIPTLTVPQGVFKEPGALVVVAHGAAGPLRVASIAVETASCERNVYVQDRFTAIRLNRGR